MTLQTKLIGTLAVLSMCTVFPLTASAEGSGNGAESADYEPMGQHQTRECILRGMLGDQLPPHCKAEFEVWRQDFTLDTDGWVDKSDPGPTGWCGSIERVVKDDLTGAADEIRPLSGDGYAVVRHGECNEFYSEAIPDGSAPASTLRPHNESLPNGGFVSALHVYLDPDWPEGSGFGYVDSFQVLDEEWPNFRYVFVPVERNEDGLFVGTHEVTEAGWYRFSTIFTPNKRDLSVDFVLQRHGWPLHRQSLDKTFLTEEQVDSFNVNNVSNAYIWFAYISGGLDLAIDEEHLR